METSAASPAPRHGFFRRLFSWRGILFLLAAFITLVTLLLVEENWRGGRAWQNYKRAMEAKGESFDTARLIPPKVPEDQNFAAYSAPILDRIASHLPEPVHASPHAGWPYGLATDLIDWAVAFQGTNSDAPHPEITDPVRAASLVLENLKSCDAARTELEAASTRPYCRFNLPYEEWDNPRDTPALMEQFAMIKRLYRLLSLHAEAELVSGRTDPALNDINVMFRLDDGLKDEPLLISQLVRLSGVSFILQPVGEGLAEHRWSEAQLRVLQDRLQKTDLLASIVRSTYGERDILVNPTFDRGNMNPRGIDMFPRGWARLEQLSMNRAFHDMVFSRIDLAAREISPSVNHSIDLAFKQFSDGNWFRIVVIQHSLFAKMLLPAYSRVAQKAAFAQSEEDMAMLACALERYRLAEGHYPEQLNALVPSFVAVLPHDIINGQPLKYRRNDDGRFILYSIGWNEKDDGGVVATNKEKHQDVLQGDWVWQYPEGN
jgi:hypothetical protein